MRLVIIIMIKIIQNNVDYLFFVFKSSETRREMVVAFLVGYPSAIPILNSQIFFLPMEKAIYY